MRSHFLHLLLYSTLIAAFFGTLIRPTPRERVRAGVLIWIAMVGGTVALAWILFPIPR